MNANTRPRSDALRRVLALPPTVRVGALLLILSGLTLIFGGGAGTFAWAGYAYIATQDAVPRTPESLAKSPPSGLRTLSRVEITPAESAQISVRGEAWTLFAIEETEGVVFLSPGELVPNRQEVVVERDNKVLIPACSFRTKYMTPWTNTFRLNDPRPQASRDARVAGWTSVFGWPTGLMLGLVGLVMVRRGS